MMKGSLLLTHAYTTTKSLDHNTIVKLFFHRVIFKFALNHVSSIPSHIPFNSFLSMYYTKLTFQAWSMTISQYHLIVVASLLTSLSNLVNFRSNKGASHFNFMSSLTYFYLPPKGILKGFYKFSLKMKRSLRYMEPMLAF
jgi:hypothetical protein